MASCCRTAAAVLQQLAIADHRRQALAERIEAVGFGQLQVLGQGIGRLRAVGVHQQLQDRLAAGDGILVATGLARRVRVVDAARLRLAGRRHRHRGLAPAGRLRGRGSVGHPARQLPSSRLFPGGFPAAALRRRLAASGTGLAAAAAALAWCFRHRVDVTRPPATARWSRR